MCVCVCVCVCQILYNQQSVEVQGNLKRRLITRLQPDTDYSFVLMSRGNSAGGLQQQVSIRTSPDLFKSKPVLYSQQQAQGGRLTIDLPRMQTAAQVQWVVIFCLACVCVCVCVYVYVCLCLCLCVCVRACVKEYSSQANQKRFQKYWQHFVF